MRSWRWILVAGLLALVLSCSGGVTPPPRLQVGETQTVDQTIPLPPEVKQAHVRIDMGAGNLVISGGTEELLEAHFAFNVPEWKPEVESSVVSDQVRLTVRQPAVQKSPMGGGVVNDWTLALSRELPIEMTLNLGACDARVDLSELSLTGLEVTAGAGDMDLTIGGSGTLSTMQIQMGVGTLTLDLRGSWETNLDVDIQGGVGEVTLYLPAEPGVRVKVERGVGDVKIENLTDKGNGIYVNEAYDKADVTLNINLKTGVGDVRIVGDQ